MIIYVINGASGYSGAAKQALLQASIFNENEIRFVTVGGAIPEIKKSIVFNNSIHCWTKLVLLFMNKKVTMIHFHGFFMIPIFIASILLRSFIVKTTLLGDDDALSLKNKKFGFIRLLLLKRARRNIVLTKKMQSIAKACGVDNVYLLPNSVLIPSIDIAGKESIFIIVGLVCERKSTLEGILFFKEKIMKILPNARLYIIGPLDGEGIPEFSADYYEECLKQSNSNIFFTGNLSSDELSHYYKRAKGIIFFSKSEGMPNALLEGMAYGCIPFINDACDGSTEVIDKKELHFTNKMKNEELLNILHTNHYNYVFREIVKKNYSSKTILPKLRELYKL